MPTTQHGRRKLLMVMAISCCGLASTGCQMLSTAAYSIGGFFDPNQRTCVDHVGNCSLCGENAPQSNIAQVGYICPNCGVNDPAGGIHGGPATTPAYDLSGQVEEIRLATASFRKELDDVNTQLEARGQALVQTRAQLSRVQNDVGNLRGNLANWQTSVHQLHQQIRQRDAERLAALGEMSQSLQQIMRKPKE